MYFQIKAIRKGTKPPIWRRAYIPSNITFAQLALILETILEYDASDLYEFEFYQKKDRIIEWHQGDQNQHDFYYSFLNAPDTYINNWLFNEGWFSFRLRKENSNAPEYRVEIEKKLEAIRIEDCGEMKDLSYPIIFKQVSAENDRFWSDIYAINDTLKNEYFTVKSDSETDSDYSYISELRKRIKAGRGIATSNDMVNRDIHTKKSTNSTLRELVDNVLRPYAFEKAKDISNGIEYDEETGEILSPEEAVKKTAEKLMVEMVFGKNQTAHNAASERADTSQCTNRSVNASMKGILNAYTKQDLCEIAKEAGLQLTASRKDIVVYELTRYLLEPQTMREQLLKLDGNDLDAFEKAMEKGRFTPSDEEAQELAAAYAALYNFFNKDMHVDDELCYRLCLRAFSIFSVGGKVSDYIDSVNEMDVAFDSDDQADKLISLAMQANNNTRMFGLKGHKPLEAGQGITGFPKGKAPVIAPMSTPAAGLPEHGKSKLPAASTNKVYPNDPCPCGSGKKFKKCCGRK